MSFVEVKDNLAAVVPVIAGEELGRHWEREQLKQLQDGGQTVEWVSSNIHRYWGLLLDRKAAISGANQQVQSHCTLPAQVKQKTRNLLG